MMRLKKVLFVASSTNKIDSIGAGTGVWMEVLASSYYIFKENNAEVQIASPIGGKVPVDPKSLSIVAATRNSKRFLKDKEAMNFLNSSRVLDTIRPTEFDALFLPGGHGSLWDLMANASLKTLIGHCISCNKPVALVAQACASLLSIQNTSGNMFVSEKRLTASTRGEEEASGIAHLLPVIIENECVKAGARYYKAGDFMSHVIVDGNIITGQNAASAQEAATKMIKILKDDKYFATAVREQPLKSSSL